MTTGLNGIGRNMLQCLAMARYKGSSTANMLFVATSRTTRRGCVSYSLEANHQGICGNVCFNIIIICRRRGEVIAGGPVGCWCWSHLAIERGNLVSKGKADFRG